MKLFSLWHRLFGIFFATLFFLPIAAQAANITISDAGVQAISNEGKHSFGMDGCSYDFGDTGLSCTTDQDANRDVIYVPFSGGIDTTAMEESSDGAIIPNISRFLDIFQTWQYPAGNSSECGPEEEFDTDACIGKFRANLAESYGRVMDTEASDFSVNANDSKN